MNNDEISDNESSNIPNFLVEDLNKRQGLYKRLYYYTFSKVRNQHDAEDIIQDLFLNIMKRENTYKKELDKSKCWVWKVLNNSIIEFFRKKNKKKEINESQIGPDEGPSGMYPADSSHYNVLDILDEKRAYLLNKNRFESPEQIVIKKEEKKVVRAAIPKLNKRQRYLLIKRYYKGKSYKGLVEDFDIPMGTVKSGLNSAKRKFAELEEIAALNN